tara:strand:+ start:1755 stop:1880 length:126 start_codon:yes stop_codon:yes gene_type:complete
LISLNSTCGRWVASGSTGNAGTDKALAEAIKTTKLLSLENT